ncbi:hypothetical protein MPI44_004572 [Klebsiella oxytoca]|nr:hypothetical protein [Klebsiella oxytoca]
MDKMNETNRVGNLLFFLLIIGLMGATFIGEYIATAIFGLALAVHHLAQRMGNLVDAYQSSLPSSKEE